MRQTSTRRSFNPTMPAWNRFSEMEELFERVFQDPFALFEGRSAAPRDSATVEAESMPWIPVRAMVEERDDAFLLSMDVPGVKKEDLKINIETRVLTVSGHRSHGRFQRSFQLPESVDAESIEAHLEDGVLQLALPKLEVSKSRTIQVQSGQSGFFTKLLGREAKGSKEDAAH